LKTTFRAFVALWLPLEVVQLLSALEEKLRSKDQQDAVRWVRPDQIHLTLLFLGHLPNEQLAGLESALKQTAAECEPFQLRMEGAGCFPGPKKPRVLWAGCGGDLDLLRALQQQVENSCAPYIRKPEKRPFKPHLTFGRVRNERKPFPTDILKELEKFSAFQSDFWQVKSFQLMESQLSSKGATYTRLADYNLEGGTAALAKRSDDEGST
jgi:RNA 2',3'-cyclic 3'-phosphodiesterase